MKPFEKLLWKLNMFRIAHIIYDYDNTGPFQCWGPKGRPTELCANRVVESPGWCSKCMPMRYWKGWL